MSKNAKKCQKYIYPFTPSTAIIIIILPIPNPYQKSVPLYCTLKKAEGVDSFLENIIRKQAENSYFYQFQKMPKNTENILFTKGVQYVNVQCSGDAFANPPQNYDKCSILKSTKQSRLIEK